MREGLKLKDCFTVSSFELYVSQTRKITSMAVKKERVITDVIRKKECKIGTLKHVYYVNYHQNRFHLMREWLKLQDCLSVSSFELYVSQKRKITSMAVKKERLITDVITCVFLNKTFFFQSWKCNCVV